MKTKGLPRDNTGVENTLIGGQKLEDKKITINTCPSNFTPKFSIVMPVHNEEDSILGVVKDVHNKLGSIEDFPFEIVLAEDGSSDNTKQAIIQLSKEIPLKAVLFNKRKGYAGGIKEGLKLVSSPYVLFSDSDGQHSPEDFWKLKKKLEELESPEKVIVSGNRMSRFDSFHRRIISKTFQKLNGIIFDLSYIKDITSPFKLVHSNLAKSIAAECKYMSESFWTEFIVRAASMKVKIIEVPVEHSNRAQGETVVYKKSKIPKIVLNQLSALVKLNKELKGESFITSVLKTKLVRRLITFAAVGASGAAIIMLLMWLFVSVYNLNYLISGAIAVETSIFWAFFLNDRITFKDKVRTDNTRIHWLKRLLKYNLSAGAGEAINLSLLFILTSTGYFYLTSEAIAILVVFIFNFTMSSKWVWRNTKIS